MEPTWESEDQVSQQLINQWETSQSESETALEAQANSLAQGTHPDAGLGREEMREAVPV